MQCDETNFVNIRSESVHKKGRPN